MDYKAKQVYKNPQIAATYDKQRFQSILGKLGDRTEKRLILNAIARTGITAPAKILDLPCGTGRISLTLAEKGYYIEGVDISKEMLAQAFEKIEGGPYQKQIKLTVGDAESLAFDDDSFDLTVSLRLFGHLPPLVRNKVLNEIKRVTKSYVVIAYYHSRSIQNMLREKKRKRNNIVWYPATVKEMNDELKAVNLTMVKMFPMFFGFSETIVVLASK